MIHERKQINGIPQWEACSCGKIFSKPLNRYLAGRIMKDSGTVQVGKMIGGKKGKLKLFSVHRLICLAFHGEPINGRDTVNHKDFNRQNNIPSNLEWMSIKENISYSVINNRRMKKLTKDAIVDIMNNCKSWDRKNGATNYAKKYGVHRSNIHAILNGTSHKHIKQKQ